MANVCTSQRDQRMTGRSRNLDEGTIADTATETPTWVDPQTGLEWQYRSPGKMTWHEAMEFAQSLELGGRSDWRLPSALELESLLDRKILLERIRPAMRKEIPFRDRLSYWSSTTFAPDTRSAWIVMFDGAYVLSYYKSSPYHVRCVRGRMIPA